MDIETQPTATPPGPPRRRSALAGALVGMVALTGTIVGVSTVAGAQAEPAPVDPADAVDDSETAESVELDEAAWQPYEECIDAQLGDIEDPFGDLLESEGVEGEGDLIEGELIDLTDAEWEAFDAAWTAADDACRDLLPAEVQAEMAEWDAYDECVGDLGALEDGLGEAIVFVETGDGSQIVNFGEVEGSVTITGTAGGVTVTTDGGVTLLDEATLDAEWAAFDEAHTACEDLVPEGFSFDEAEFED